MYDNINHFKSVTAYEFFIKPADRNYLLARWMLMNDFTQEFFWQASQAAEKYLKATLILNDLSVAENGHALAVLTDRHRETFGKLTIAEFEKPAELDSQYWRDDNLDMFLRRLERCGNPDSRYGLVSWNLPPGELFRFDQLVFALRRLTVGLDWLVGEDFEISPPARCLSGKSFREALMLDPRFEPRGPIENLNHSLSAPGPTRGDTLHAWNFEFLRAPYDLEKGAPRSVGARLGSAENSYLSHIPQVSR